LLGIAQVIAEIISVKNENTKTFTRIVHHIFSRVAGIVAERLICCLYFEIQDF
jgi:hypothetical protein